MAGISIDANSMSQAFTWTPDGRRLDWEEAGILTSGETLGVSGDGGTVVGVYASTPTQATAFRRVGNNPPESLGLLGGWQWSEALHASFDGRTIAGVNKSFSGGQSYSRAFVWTPDTGMRPLGAVGIATQSEPTSVSADGSTIVGWSFDDFGTTREVPLVWRNGGAPTVLPLAPGGERYGGVASDVSADGRVVVGISYGGLNSALRWTDGAMEILPFPVGYDSGGAAYITDDSSMILGTVLAPGAGLPFRAYLWLQSGQGVFLDEYWERNGVHIPAGWSPYNLFGMSGDGTTIVGTMRHAVTGDTQGFVATIPATGVLTGFCCLAGVMYAPRRRRA